MVEEIQPNLYRIEIPLPRSPLKVLNAYVVTSSDRNLIIDTGFGRKECLEAMQEGLRTLKLDLRKTDFYITHYHADHIGLVPSLIVNGNKTFLNRTDTAMLHIADRWESYTSYVRMSGLPEETVQKALRNHPGYLHSLEPLPELTVSDDGDVIQVGEYHFRCVETPGHTPGHTCLYDPFKKILLSGDHILGDITPNIACLSKQGNPLENYLNSLDKTAGLDVALVLPGHRLPFTNCKERIRELKQHHQRRLEEVLSIMRGKGPKTAPQIASEMTWDIAYASWDLFPAAQKWFATGEAVAHLRYLERKGVVTQRLEENTILYSLPSRNSKDTDL